MTDLGRRLARRLGAATLDRIGEKGPANARENRPRMERSVLALQDVKLGEGDTAVVVGAGPSLRQRRSLQRLLDTRYRGTIVVADGALGACLRAGVVPHVVVTVDPDPDRIVRWFGDPELVTPPADDYFRRQEMDEEHAKDELAANRELRDLVDDHGSSIRLAVASSVAPRVVERALKARMELFWWNPFYDDPDGPTSLTARLFRENGLPCINGGGNVGSASWVLAHSVLRKRRIALIGIDFGYAPNTPREKTQYYPELLDFARTHEADVGDTFIDFVNPVTGETWFCDPAYWWFREVFLEMVQTAECETYNCTEGGILYGPGVERATIEAFCNPVRGAAVARVPGEHAHG